MRRYELMLVLRPDIPDERSQAIIDRTTRQIASSGGQIVKVAPWGRRRLAYPIDRHREGSYHIVIFEAPGRGDRRAGARPADHRGAPPPPRHPGRAPGQVRPARGTPRSVDLELEAGELPSGEDEEEEETGERIDESESEAAPAAID